MSIVTKGTIILTCDECHIITDTFGGTATKDVWQEIAQAGWQLNRQDFTCVCPDCLHRRDQDSVGRVKFYKPE